MFLVRVAVLLCFLLFPLKGFSQSWGRGVKGCSKIFSSLSKREYIIDYSDSKVVDYIVAISRLYIEYPRSFFKVEKNLEYAEIKVPESYWKRIFKDDFATVTQTLSKVNLFRDEVDWRGKRVAFDEGSLFMRPEVMETPLGDKIYSLRFDFRLAELIQRQQEIAVIVMYLESGIIASQKMN